MEFRNLVAFAFALGACIGAIACTEEVIKDFPLCDEENPHLMQCGEEEGECVDLQTNVEHCGDCNHACGSGEICEAGFCVPENPDTCDAPLIMCGDVCVDTLTDAEHCGACDAACSDGETCSEGNCEPNGTPCTEAIAEEVCGEDEICIDGFCAQPRDLGDPCTKNEECKGALICDEGYCAEDEPECISDEDCTEPGHICDDETKACREGCRTDDDCPGDAICVTGEFVCIDL